MNTTVNKSTKIFCTNCHYLSLRDWKGYDHEVGCQVCSASVDNLQVWGNK